MSILPQLLLAALCLFLSSGCEVYSDDIDEGGGPNVFIYGAEANSTGNPIGGGAGYSHQVKSSDYLVQNAAELIAALEQARAGETIKVANDAVIDLTGHSFLYINEGVTLAGNRGQDGAEGPLIFLDEIDSEQQVVFWVQAGARVSGLRFRGPDADFPDIDYDIEPRSDATCLALEGEGIEVDNCEISNFERGAVEVYPNGKDVYIHHNFIHDNHAYAVIVLNRSALPVLIEANLIHWVWSAMAGSGYPGSGYEARYNRVIRKPVPASWEPYDGQHAVDMHSFLEVYEARNQRIGGDWMSVHHNTFISEAPDDPSVALSNDAFVRGVPRNLAQFFNNKFLNSDPEQAVMHVGGNVWVYNNLYGTEETPIYISDQSTPQILFHTPPPPDIEIPTIDGGAFSVDIEINLNNPSDMTLTRVLIELNGDTIYSEDHVPQSDELMIDQSMINSALPYQELKVTAVDDREIAGSHMTVFNLQ